MKRKRRQSLDAKPGPTVEGAIEQPATGNQSGSLPAPAQRKVDIEPAFETGSAAPGNRMFSRVARKARFSDELVAEARSYFERRLARPIREDEARKFLGDLSDFYIGFSDFSKGQKQ
jgi:hypothetical protein